MNRSEHLSFFSRTACFPLLLVLSALLFLPSAARALGGRSEQGFRHEVVHILSLAGSYPVIPYGLSYAYVRPKLPGVYVDIRGFSVRPAVSSNTVGFDSRTAEEKYGSVFQGNDISRLSMNLGLFQPVFDRLAVFVAGGISIKFVYARYFDAPDTIPWVYTYWVRDRTVTYFSGVAGLTFLVIKNPGVTATVGITSMPRGILAGIGYAW